MFRTCRSRYWIGLVGVVLASLSCLSCRPDNGLELCLLDHDGELRSYYLHVPQTLDLTQPVPLVIALHRLTETGEEMALETGFNECADGEDFIVAYPNGKFRAFSFGIEDDPDDNAFVLSVIEDVAAKYEIDRSRIYLVGASNGGLLVYTLICEHPEIFAAAAPVMATFLEKHAEAIQPGNGTPVFIMHGEADFVLPYYSNVLFAGKLHRVLSVPETVQYWAKVNKCRPEPVIERIPNIMPSDGTKAFKETYLNLHGVPTVVHVRVRGGGHTWPGGYEPLPPFMTGRQNQDFNATEMIWDFFSQHRLNATPPTANRSPRR
jgi:polyhydroxybutyrate depolymerase